MHPIPCCRKAFNFVLGGVLCFVVLGWLNMNLPWSLSFNHSESLPLGLYLLNKRFDKQELQQGKIVAYTYSTANNPALADNNYFKPFTTIIKPILGTAPEVVQELNHKIYICPQITTEELLHTCKFGGNLVYKDSKARPITPVKWLQATIPPGYLFVGTPNIDNSLDSRYVGLVKVTEVKAIVKPLLTW